MVEIYAGNMSQFFENSGFSGKCTYKSTDRNGVEREIWEISNEVLEAMSEMMEEEFLAIAGDDAWWRYAKGSNMGIPFESFTINGKKVRGWDAKKNMGYKSRRTYESLLDYFCNNIGASQPRNVCALAVDLAKYNGMTMGQLFTELQP